MEHSCAAWAQHLLITPTQPNRVHRHERLHQMCSSAAFAGSAARLRREPGTRPHRSRRSPLPVRSRGARVEHRVLGQNGHAGERATAREAGWRIAKDEQLVASPCGSNRLAARAVVAHCAGPDLTPGPGARSPQHPRLVGPARLPLPCRRSSSLSFVVFGSSSLSVFVVVVVRRLCWSSSSLSVVVVVVGRRRCRRSPVSVRSIVRARPWVAGMSCARLRAACLVLTLAS